jgi:tetratricopeptide (TPR) repeat protein
VRRALPALAVSIVTALFFVPGLRGEFLSWDDWNNFTLNPHYRGLSGNNLAWMFTTFHMGHYQPLTWLTLGLDYELWGMNPVGYHATSLLLHALAAGLLCVVLQRLFASEPAAAIGALFWSIHPLRVESVSWITERRDVLCGVFFLLSVLAYLRMAREREGGGRWGRWLALSVAAYAASLLSKSLGIMLPLALLVLDAVVLNRFAPGKRRAALVEKLPYLACAVAVFVVTLFAMKSIGQVRTAAAPLERAAQASFGTFFYLWKTLVPVKLSPLYPVEHGIDPGEARFVVAMIALPLATVGLALLARKRPAPFAAWVAYGLLAGPVLGAIVRGAQIAADRYTYLAVLPWSLLLAGAIRGPLGGPAARPTLGVAAAVLLALGTLTAFQTRAWHSSLELWDQAVRSGWGGAVAYTNRGAERFRKGDLDGAMVDTDEAIRLDPGHGLAYMNRANILVLRKQWDAALAEYGRSIECEWRSPEPYERRAALRELQGDFRGAIADCGEAIARFPSFAGPWLLRAKLRHRVDDLKGAVADFDEGLKRSPRDAAAVYERGQCRYALGDSDGAWKDFSAAIAIDPGLRDARLNRGSITALRGLYAAAILDFSEEIRINPGSVDAWRNRGLARWKTGAKAEARSDFEQVLRIAPPGWPGRREVEGFLVELRKK